MSRKKVSAIIVGTRICEIGYAGEIKTQNTVTLISSSDTLSLTWGSILAKFKYHFQLDPDLSSYAGKISMAGFTILKLNGIT